MEILLAIIIGFVVGLLARALKPGKDSLGLILTTLLGIGGSVLAGLTGRALGWYRADEPAGFIASIIGAITILAIVSFFRSHRAVHH